MPWLNVPPKRRDNKGCLNLMSTVARILIVEDEPAVSGLLEGLLGEKGYRTEIAIDGREASEKMLSFNPDLVLLDLRIPQRAGTEVLVDIRKRNQEYGSFVPVIILTGVYTDPKDKIAMLEAGADDFLAKPFEVVELIARVRSLLRVQELYKRSQFLASHDYLTRCYNRRYLMEFLGREFERHKRYGNRFAYLQLDMDRFKRINDELGHEAGDQLLMFAGARLQDFFRAVDCVARVGGDEFAAVLPDCGPAEAAKVGARLMDYLIKCAKEAPVPAPHAGAIGWSVGIACLPDHSVELEELMRFADEAMYAAKREGSNRFRVHEAPEKRPEKQG